MISTYGVLIIIAVSAVSEIPSYLGMPSVMSGLGDTVADLYQNFLGITSILVAVWLITFSLKKYFSFKLQVPKFPNLVISTLGIAAIISPLGLGGSIGQIVFNFFAQVLGDILTVVPSLLSTIYFIEHAYKWILIPTILKSVGVKKTRVKPCTKSAIKKSKTEPPVASAKIDHAINLLFNSGLHADDAMIKR